MKFLLLLLALAGCANQNTLRGTVALGVADKALLFSGPTKGHFYEESSRVVGVWVSRGRDCPVTEVQDLSLMDRGTFTLKAGEHLCAVAFRRGARITWHAGVP